MKFLEKLARQINSNHVDVADLAIVLPNRRAGRLLLQYMADMKTEPFFAPQLFTIDEFIEFCSPLKKTTHEELIKMLFAIYKNTLYGEDKTFEVFYPWAEMFLHDIDEVDMQLADARTIFGNLSEIKEMEISFAKQELSDNQRKYLSFYKNLFELYQKLNQQLYEKKMAYSGAIYKDVAQNIESQFLKNNHFSKIYFAGLSALTPAEFKIISSLLNLGKAEIFFDFDPFYENSSAILIEKIKSDFGDVPINWISNDYKSVNKRIDEVAVSGKFTQIYYAINALNEIEKREGTLNDTALVLADESLVLPFIHAYPSEKCNITMGYPFRETSGYQLVKQLILLVKNSFRFQEIRNANTPLYYHKDVIAILENPLVIHLFSDRKTVSSLIEMIKNSNRSFYDENEICRICKEFPWPKPKKGVQFLQELIAMIGELTKLYQDQSDFRTSLQIIHQQLSEIATFLTEIDQIDTLDFNTILYYFDKRSGELSIPLNGTFDKGLQVMGLLESRALDFKNVIILSVNEGVLPNTSRQNSLILFDIKRHFNLPLMQEKEAVFAYHFFRLLQRAENVLLVYDEDSADSLAERSRFIAQLHFEIKTQKCGNIEYVKEQFAVSMPPDSNSLISVKKNQSILDVLYAKKYSASLLTKYINCPLQFYFAAVAGIKPTKDISEEIEQNVIGTIIHSVLENIVKQIIVNPMEKKKILSEALGNVENMVCEEIAQMDELKNIDMDRGKPFLYKGIILRYLTNYLEILEESSRDVEFLSSEKEIETCLSIQGKSISLHGFIDRIDRRNQEILIIDYKTGRVDENDLKITDFSTIFQQPEKSKVFQLMIYLYLYCRELKDIPATISTGIISFIQLNKERKEVILTPYFKDFTEEESSPQSLYEKVESGLINLFEEIVDENINFTGTSDKKRCKYCDFTAICGR